jgi:hypothetical protein
MTYDGRLQVLPNKDLWRGSVRIEEPVVVEEPATEPTIALSPLDKAYLDVIKTAAGGPLNCLWCAQQFKETELKEHLRVRHPSVADPMKNAEVAMHQAQVNEQKAATV